MLKNEVGSMGHQQCEWAAYSLLILLSHHVKRLLFNKQAMSTVSPGTQQGALRNHWAFFLLLGLALGNTPAASAEQGVRPLQARLTRPSPTIPGLTLDAPTIKNGVPVRSVELSGSFLPTQKESLVCSYTHDGKLVTMTLQPAKQGHFTLNILTVEARSSSLRRSWSAPL